MSMYVDVLSGALDAWNTDLSGRALLDYVLACRMDLLASSTDRAQAYESLAAEIAYDRALIALCADTGIAVSATDFADPSSERTRLEATLRADADLDLVSLTRARARAHLDPGPSGFSD